MTTTNITDDLFLMLSIFPDDIQAALQEKVTEQHLIEVVMDLGRKPFAQFADDEIILSEREITQPELDRIVELAEKYADSRPDYTKGKDTIIKTLLREAGWTED